MRQSYAFASWMTQAMPDRLRRAAARWRDAGMRDVISRPGLLAMCHGPVSALGRGMVIGELHGGAASSVKPRRTEDACDFAERLLRLCFGDYVALLVDDGGAYGITDPSGAGRGYLAHDGEVTIMSDLITPGCVASLGMRARPDHDALAACIAHPPSLAAARLLDAVQPMIPGVLYRFGDLRSRTLWSPGRPASMNRNAEGALRSAVDASVAACSGERPLLQLSGGLDSAIVGTSLAAQGKPVECFTFRSDDGDADELSYARAVGSACAADLHETTAARLPDYGRIFATAQHATPYLYGLDDVFEEAVEDLAKRVGADRIVTGQGGDAVFLRTTSPMISADRLRDLGPGAAFLRGAAQDAIRSRRSVWHHLLPAFRARWSAPGTVRDLLVPDVLHPGRRADLRLRLHPWVEAAADQPPGRRMQIELIASCQLFQSHRPFGKAALASPLLAQPVVEAVLGMPSWQIADGPLDRGLARRAFASRLPPGVAARRSKGEASARFSRAAVANLPTLREHLLDGALVEAEILDRQEIERILHAEHMFYSLDYRTVAVLVSCEAWLRAWR